MLHQQYLLLTLSSFLSFHIGRCYGYFIPYQTRARLVLNSPQKDPNILTVAVRSGWVLQPES